VDAIGQITQITDANSGLTKFSYDGAGNQLTLTHANGHAVLGMAGNRYDLRNRPTFAHDALARIIHKD
jgi:YD repeat-containing protein